MRPHSAPRPARPGIALALLAVAGLSVAPAGGEAAAAEPPRIPTIEVTLAPKPAVFEHGKAAFYRGTVDGNGVVFSIPGLGINTPAAVIVESSAPDARLVLRLKNDYSTDWDRTLDTGRAGALMTQFRTEGSAVALLRSDGPLRPYRMVVWVGPEAKLHTVMPTPFTRMEDAHARRGWWVAAGLGLFAMLAFVWWRRRGRAAP